VNDLTEEKYPVMEKEKQPSRRQVLILKAQELFARKGIDAVSLNEINKAAGQRNTSALHYHFGNKQGLIKAIIYEHYAAIDQQINQQLDQFEALPKAQQTPRNLLSAIVTSFSQQLDTREGIDYLLIVSQMFVKGTELILEGHPSGEDRARMRIFNLGEAIFTNIAPQVRSTKTVLCASLMINALATYAQSMSSEEHHRLGDKALFISNLIDSVTAIVEATPSAATLQLLEQ